MNKELGEYSFAIFYENNGQYKKCEKVIEFSTIEEAKTELVRIAKNDAGHRLWWYSDESKWGEVNFPNKKFEGEGLYYENGDCLFKAGSEDYREDVHHYWIKKV